MVSLGKSMHILYCIHLCSVAIHRKSVGMPYGALMSVASSSCCNDVVMHMKKPIINGWSISVA